MSFLLSCLFGSRSTAPVEGEGRLSGNDNNSLQSQQQRHGNQRSSWSTVKVMPAADSRASDHSRSKGNDGGSTSSGYNRAVRFSDIKSAAQPIDHTSPTYEAGASRGTLTSSPALSFKPQGQRDHGEHVQLSAAGGNFTTVPVTVALEPSPLPAAAKAVAAALQSVPFIPGSSPPAIQYISIRSKPSKQASASSTAPVAVDLSGTSLTKRKGATKAAASAHAAPGKSAGSSSNRHSSTGSKHTRSSTGSSSAGFGSTAAPSSSAGLSYVTASSGSVPKARRKSDWDMYVSDSGVVLRDASSGALSRRATVSFV